MYKVFVNDKPIILSDLAVSTSEYEIYLFKNTGFEEIIHKLQNTKVPGIYIYYNDLDTLWDKFKDFFEIVKAAGGVVENDKGELLFIRRNERWDFPKGRMELGEVNRETALREVAEECDISETEIIDDLAITYHVYQDFGKFKLKKTYWYWMKSNDLGVPCPQKEEGITEAVFIAADKWEQMYPDMYANIKELVIKFKNIKGI